MIKLSSSFKNLLKKIGVFAGVVSCFMMLPIIWTFATFIDGAACGDSPIEEYTYFIMQRPFVLIVFFVSAVWMMIAINVKEAK